MKKLTALLACLALVLLCACGSKAPAAPTDASQTPAAGTEESPRSGKVLVAYFSATSHTERVAGDIAAAAGGDLFAIVPAQPYSADDLDYNDPDSRVSREHNDPSLQDVPLAAAAPDNWSDYDVVFIGYPIWWGSAAWPVNTFLKGNDFTGKTVIPFATSASSGLGSSADQLAQMAGTGTWQAGQRFSSGVSAGDIQAWVSGLGLQNE